MNFLPMKLNEGLELIFLYFKKRWAKFMSQAQIFLFQYPNIPISQYPNFPISQYPNIPIFQTIKSVRSNNLSSRYQRFTSSGCQDKEIRKF